MSGTVEQSIQVKIKAIIDGLKDVQHFQHALKEIKSQGGKRFNLDTSRAQTDGNKLITVLRTLSPAADRTAASVETLAGKLGAGSGLLSVLTPVAAGVGAVGAVVAATGAILLKAVRDFEEYGSRIRDLQEENGLAAETLTTIDAAAQLAGSSLDEASASVSIYLKNISEAANGNKQTAQTFKRFGIDATEALKDPDKAVRDLLDGLAKIPNHAERLDAAFQLAGRSGKVLAKIAEEMGGSFERFKQQAQQWGVVLSEEDVQAADKFGDAVTVMGYKVRGILYSIARGALPELQAALDDTSGGVGVAQQAWEAWGRSAGRSTGGLIAKLKELNDQLNTAAAYLDWLSGGKSLNQQNKEATGFDFEKGLPDPDKFKRDLEAQFGGGTGDKKPTLNFGGFGGRGGGGGGKGRGGESLADKLFRARAKEEETALEALHALLESGFNLFKDSLDREQKALDESLEDKLVSLEYYFEEKARLQNEDIENELARQRVALEKADEKLKAANKETSRKSDKGEITAEERRLEENAALNEYDTARAKIEERITVLEREQEEIAERVAREKGKALKAVREEMDAVRDALRVAEGRELDVKLSSIADKYEELRRKAKALGDESEPALALLDRAEVVERDAARFENIVKTVNAQLELLRAREEAVDSQQLLEGFSDEEAIRRKLKLQREIVDALQDQKAAIAVLEKSTSDPVTLAALQRIKNEIEQVGVRVDTVGRAFNDGLKQDLKETLSSIITDTKNFGEHLINLARSILDRISDMIADRLIEKAFGPGGILDGLLGGGGSGGSASGVGGWLSKILGFPQPGTGGGGQGQSSNSQDVFGSIPGIIKNFQSVTSGGLQFVGANTAGLRQDTQGGFNLVDSKMQEILTFLPNLLPAEVPWWKSALLAAVGVVATAGNAAAAKRFGKKADGGYISGPGTGTSDSIPAWLSNGEYVLRAASVRNLGTHVLDYINASGRLPAFADGGLVGEMPTLNLAAGGDIHQHFTTTIVTPNPSAFQASKQQIERDVSRAASRGVNRGRRG